MSPAFGCEDTRVDTEGTQDTEGTEGMMSSESALSTDWPCPACAPCVMPVMASATTVNVPAVQHKRPNHHLKCALEEVGEAGGRLLALMSLPCWCMAHHLSR